MNLKLKKLFSGLILSLSVVALVSCGSSKSNSDDGKLVIKSEIESKEYSVEFDKKPEKAVSLAGFTTEMLLDLGLEDSMAGYAYQDNPVTDEFKDAIAKVKELARENPSQEVLLDAKPDFLTGWKSSFSEKNFSPKFCMDNNMKFYLPRSEYPKANMDTVYEDYENLGKIFKVEDRAKKIIEKMKDGIAKVEKKVKDKEKVKVFIFDSGEEAPFTAGNGLASDMIRLAGGKNIFADLDKNWTEVSWEKVIEANPEYIIVMKYDASDDTDKKIAFLKSNNALKNIPAIKNNKIKVMGLSDVLPGPRDVNAIKIMAEFFHPEAFK